MSQMIDAEAVATALGVSRSHVYKLADENKLPFETHKIGNVYRFLRREVEEFLGEPLAQAQRVDL